MSALSEPWLRGILRCPVCHATLADGPDASGRPALLCEGDCRDGDRPRAYAIEDGIPVLLPPEITDAPAPGGTPAA